MSNPANAIVGCHLVGEYVDEAELPANLAFHRGEVVRPQAGSDYLDLGAAGDSFKEFTVLLKDGRVVSVRGQGLKNFPAAVQGESGSYGVIVRTGGAEVLVALFKAVEVVGIFHGEMSPDRKIA